MRIRPNRRPGVILFAAASLLLTAGGHAAAKKALAVFKETTHDFGKVKQGDVLTYEFIFTNKGEGTLSVERVETSCGCTAALASADKIAPGAEGKIKATLNTHGYQGKFTRYIFFSSNDASSQRRELSVTADIEVPPQAKIELDRYNIDMGVVLEGESPSVKVLIKNVGERELKVEIGQQDIKFSSEGKPLTFPLSIQAGGSKEVELTFPPQTKVGSLRDYVLIRSNDAVRSTLSVYISRYVVTKKELKDLFNKYKAILGVRN